MIKLVNLGTIPKSLDDRDKISAANKTTSMYRNQVISTGKYIHGKAFNARYKTNDIKFELNRYHNGKCAFCETIVHQMHVEHYRPKSYYYWLAYSWDNLLLACPMCNTAKSDKFDTLKPKASFNPSRIAGLSINSVSHIYDELEMPLMVNPEVTDPKGMICFTKDGKILAKSQRFRYTIKEVQLNREILIVSRRKCIDILRENIRDIFIEHIDEPDLLRSNLTRRVKEFKRDCDDQSLPYLAFRNFALTSGWIRDIISSIKEEAYN